MTRYLLLLSLVFCSASAVLAEEIDVYLGEAVVEGQSRAERDRMLPLALQNALSRYSGVRDFSGIEGFADLLQGASGMLLTFYYRNLELLQADGRLQEQSRLVARFSPDELNALARSLGLPMWPPLRNDIEVWIVIDDGRGREIVPPRIAYVQGVLDNVTQARGQSLTWPEPDEDGMYPVDMQLLWGGYTEDLSGETGTGVLILAARREGAEWNVRANLGFAGYHRAWRVRGLSLEPALIQAVEETVDQVAEFSAIAASDLGEQRHRLTVAGLDSSDAYEACLAYLQSISIVDDVVVVAARPAMFTFELKLTAQPEYLERAFFASRVLVADEQINHYTFTGVK